MGQNRYIISDASKKVAVEPHVLRYWEEELGLVIPRNEMGHRYYREEELEKIRGIKRLKEQGFQLKAIKLVLPELEKIEQLPDEARQRLCIELNEKVCATELAKHTAEENDTTEIMKQESTQVQIENPFDKVQQFETIMAGIFRNVLEENNQRLSDTVSQEVTTSVVKAVNYEFREKEKQQEEHFRKMDEMLRTYQKGFQEVAATNAPEKKRKRFFRKQKYTE